MNRKMKKPGMKINRAKNRMKDAHRIYRTVQTADQVVCTVLLLSQTLNSFMNCFILSIMSSPPMTKMVSPFSNPP